MKRIVILTGSEPRHVFFQKFIALTENIEVVNTYSEGIEKSLGAILQKSEEPTDLRTFHLMAREQSEKDFFDLFINNTIDFSNTVFLPKGEINSQKYVEQIIQSDPDLLISYGCSIIKEPLTSAFKGKFINIHLGLSPYYKGSGTNYWPLVNKEPEFVGATFMFIDSGIDTGEIIHQIRARYCWGDTPSQIGNRLIHDMSHVSRKIILNFEKLEKVLPINKPCSERLYKNKDFTEESVAVLYRNFTNGLIEHYLSEKELRCEKVPIIVNPAIEEKTIQ